MIEPIPCIKFKNASAFEWIAKLAEETSEVSHEVVALVNTRYEKQDETEVRERLAEELTDVITVCVSWLYALGYDEVARGEVQRRVNEKNKARGYHDEA